MKMTCCV